MGNIEVGVGAGHEIPALAKELLAFSSCWERKRLFFLRV